MLLSIIVPIFNEELNIKPLVSEIKETINWIDHEIILVNDGSFDRTKEEILNLKYDNIILVDLARNFGQTSAMSAGIEIAKGDYIVFLDADLQNDPKDIKAMIQVAEDGNYDLVSGKRSLRKDDFFLRIIPSKVANYFIRRFTKIQITDLGCTLKLFKSKLAKSFNLYGELHRFLPILADYYGARITEISVNHRPRLSGKSKYNLERTWNVVSDLLLIMFFRKYSQKPMHLFGKIGLKSLIIGSIIEFYMLILKISGQSVGTRPLLYVGLFLLILGMQFVYMGFLSEMINRTYYESQHKKPYIIDSIYKDGKKNQDV